MTSPAPVETLPVTLARVAELVDGRLEGEGDAEIADVAPLDEAGPDDLSFLAHRRWAAAAASSEAGAVLVSEELEPEVRTETPRVVVPDAYAALATLLTHLHPPGARSPSIHRTAVLGRGVRLGRDVEIDPYAVVEDGVDLGDGVRIGAHTVVGRGSSIGAESRLHPHVVLYPETVVGRRVVVHSGARLGADGFGYTEVDGEHVKIPQVGRCVVEDDVEIGANSTIDRGSLGDTVVGRGSKLDNLVHLAHNVRTGARCLFAALVGIAGSTRIGKETFFGGQSGAIDGIRVGSGVRVVVQTGITRDVADGETLSGFPGRPHREELRAQAWLRRLPDLAARVKALEEGRPSGETG